MANYKITISSSAERQLKKLPAPAQIKISRVILGLAVNPYMNGCKKLAGYKDIWRIRIGDYRVLYSVDKKIVTVIVLKIGHRKEIYM